MYANLILSIKDSKLQSLTCLFCPGNSGIQGNEWADILAGTVAVDNNITLGPSIVVADIKRTSALIGSHPLPSL